ncbi:hypothetical protein [Planctomycetes bacterium TBK1r]|uniref:hypothetical protein n=1 Tax=Stieleria magnilauensis TaxID=2527963 RepID=UPI0011A90EA7
MEVTIDLKRLWKSILVDAWDYAEATIVHVGSAVTWDNVESMRLEGQAQAAIKKLDHNSSIYLAWWYSAEFRDKPDPGGEGLAVAAWKDGRREAIDSYYRSLYLLRRYGYEKTAEDIESGAADALMTDQLIFNYYESYREKKLHVSKKGRGPTQEHPLFTALDAAHGRLCLNSPDRLPDRSP